MVTLIGLCVLILIVGAVIAVAVKKIGAALEASPAMIDLAKWLVVAATVLIVLFKLWQGRGMFHL